MRSTSTVPDAAPLQTVVSPPCVVIGIAALPPLVSVFCVLCISLVLTLHTALADIRTRAFTVAHRSANKRRKRQDAIQQLMDLDDSAFIRMMRMPKALLLELSERITPHFLQGWTRESKRMAELSSGEIVEPLPALAATIRWLSGGSPWDVSFMFRIAPSTFHLYKWRIIDALNAVLAQNILFPTSDVGLGCLATGFHDRDDNIPNVVAAVDCIVFEMRAPTRSKVTDRRQSNVSSHFCRKGFFATTVLAFVDSKMRFLSVSINCGSSSHDSTNFGCSRMGHLLSKSKAEGGIDPKWVILGDDAFKQLPHVMTPFQKQYLSPEHKNFNYCLSKQRCVVECAFGLWKGKWGIFWRPLVVKQRNIRKLVEVTARLHNLCINRCAFCCLIHDRTRASCH